MPSLKSRGSRQVVFDEVSARMSSKKRLSALESGFDPCCCPYDEPVIRAKANTMRQTGGMTRLRNRDCSNIFLNLLIKINDNY